MKIIKIITVFVLLFCFNNSNAQSSVSSTQLQNNLWTYKSKEIVTKKYTASKQMIYVNGTLGLEEPYYLSETIVTEGNFDSTKVGVSTVGKYIVTPKGCYEIISLTDKNLVIKNVKQNHHINLFVK